MLHWTRIHQVCSSTTDRFWSVSVNKVAARRCLGSNNIKWKKLGRHWQIYSISLILYLGKFEILNKYICMVEWNILWHNFFWNRIKRYYGFSVCIPLRSPGIFENSIRTCYFYAFLCSGILGVYFKLMARVGFFCLVIRFRMIVRRLFH